MKAHFALLLLVLAACGMGSVPETSAEISSLDGIVLVNDAPAIAGHSLKQGDFVETLAGAQATILLYDSSVVRLSQNTKVEISQLTNGASRFVQLKQTTGETWTRVLKITGIAEYEIATPNAVATVRGTGFKVTVQEDATEVLVGEGTVQVAKVSDGAIIVQENVEADQKAVITSTAGEGTATEQIVVESVDADSSLKENLKEDDEHINRLIDKFDRDQLFDELEDIVEDARKLINAPVKLEPEPAQETESEDAQIDAVIANLDTDGKTIENRTEIKQETKTQTRVSDKTTTYADNRESDETTENPDDLKSITASDLITNQPIKEALQI